MEQQTKFIELRAKGLSLSSIATELSVSKRTLVNWGHKLEAEIQDLQTLEQEALQEKLLGLREARLRRQGELLAQVEAELQKRSLADLSTARLYSMAESIRKQILKETTPCSRSHAGRESVLASPDIPPTPNEDRCNNGAITVQPESASNPATGTNAAITSEVSNIQDAQVKVPSPNDSSGQYEGESVPPSPGLVQLPIEARCNPGAISVQPERASTPTTWGHASNTLEHSNLPDSQVGVLSVNDSTSQSGRERLLTSPELAPALPEERCNNGETAPLNLAPNDATKETSSVQYETEHEISDSAVGAIPDEPFVEVTLQDVMDKLPENMRQRLSQMQHTNELRRWLREYGGYVSSLFKNTSQ